MVGADAQALEAGIMQHLSQGGEEEEEGGSEGGEGAASSKVTVQGQVVKGEVTARSCFLFTCLRFM